MSLQDHLMKPNEEKAEFSDIGGDNMEKVDSPNGKIEFKFCVEVNENHNRTTKSVYMNDEGEYYLVESEEYHIGSAYDHVNTYYVLEKSEVEFFERMAIDRKRREEAESLARDKIAREDQERMLTSGDDKRFYKKRKSDTIWWLKETEGEHAFSFDKEKIFNLMTDYPEKLTPEQKEIFDKENPYWAKRIGAKKCDYGVLLASGEIAPSRAVETKTGDARASETDKYHRLEYMANGRVDWHHTIL